MVLEPPFEWKEEHAMYKQLYTQLVGPIFRQQSSLGATCLSLRGPVHMRSREIKALCRVEPAHVRTLGGGTVSMDSNVNLRDELISPDAAMRYAITPPVAASLLVPDPGSRELLSAGVASLKPLRSSESTVASAGPRQQVLPGAESESSPQRNHRTIVAGWESCLMDVCNG